MLTTPNKRRDPLPKIVWMTSEGYEQLQLHFNDVPPPTLSERVQHAATHNICQGCYQKKSEQQGLCVDCINDLFANAAWTE